MRLRALRCALVVAAASHRQPQLRGLDRRIGFAVNTRDGALEEVREIVRHGWGALALRRNATGMLVFSDTVSEDWSEGVRVRPCCGGVDYGGSIASAQLKREHTWRRMLDFFPRETWWFVSTEVGPSRRAPPRPARRASLL